MAEKRSRRRTILIAALVLVFLCVIVASLSSDDTDDATTSGTKLAEGDTITETSTPTIELTKAPTKTLSPEDALTEAIREKLGQSNRDVPRLSEVRIDDADEQQAVIIVDFAINDNLTEGMIKTGAQIDVADILEAVDESKIDYDAIWIYGSMALVDDFGNTSEENVLKMYYLKETIDKINWQNFIFENVYNIADTGWIHPVMQ